MQGNMAPHKDINRIRRRSTGESMKANHKIGDLVKWSWYLDTGWEQTPFLGIILSSHLAKHDYEKIRIFDVLANDGTVVNVREHEASLELISEAR